MGVFFSQACFFSKGDGLFVNGSLRKINNNSDVVVLFFRGRLHHKFFWVLICLYYKKRLAKP